MKGHSLSPLFAPKTIAVFGASTRSESVGGRVFENLLSFGFKGKVIPINPKRKTVLQHKCYPDLASLEDSIDLAVIATPANSVPKIIEQCGKAKIPAAIVLSAGFAEIGTEGRLLQDKVLSAAQRANIRFVGPNCLGVMRPSAGLNATFSKNGALSGNLALISQSGALCTAILDWAESQEIGFSAVVSLGATADIDLGEMLDFLARDEKTNSILLYIEGVHHARSFLRGLRAAAQLKPVIVMKAGRHQAGAKAAVSHTGAFVGADDVFDAALERTGVVRVRTFEELFSAARILSSNCQVRGNGLAIVSNAGGPGVIAADCASELGVRLPEFEASTLEKLNACLPPQWSHANPADILGDAGVDRYRGALRVCLADKNIDAVLAMLTPQAMTDPIAVAQATMTAHTESQKPVLACWMGGKQVEGARHLFTEADIPSFSTPESAMAAFSHLAQYRRNQKMMLELPSPLRDHRPAEVQTARRVIREALDSGREQLTAIESKRILEAFQIPIIPTREATSVQEAIDAAEEVGYPVALKISSPELTHKSDVGGIELNLTDANQVEEAYQTMLKRIRKVAPEANICGVTIEPMFRPSHARELIAGVISDEVFGPAISFGSGGVTVEVFKDRAVALPPLNEVLIHHMISRTKVARLLGPFRNMPPVDEAQLVHALLRLSQLVCELPEIVELDINPLVAHPGGVMALDARIVVKPVPATEAPYDHLAILPE
ncbi:MAG: acetate--CoA ligase family protein [Roseibacillus sp.]